MIRLGSVIAQFEADFMTQFRHRLSFEQLRALSAMRDCRRPASPMMQVQCEGCDQQKLVPHSCGHRLCPHCQHHESRQWLERQMQRFVPADYFLLTFTLPAESRGLVAAHAEVAFDLLMSCAWQTVHRFSQNDRQLQGTPGALTLRGPAHALAPARLPPACPSRRPRGGGRCSEAALATQAARQERRLSVQFRLPARQLQAPDRLAASHAEVRSQPLHATAQGAASDALRVLWRRDGDRRDADSIDVVQCRCYATGRCGRPLIM
jgi:hypothetical protein